MGKFEVRWVTENWHTLVVEADDELSAIDAVLNSGMIFHDETTYAFDYLQDDSIEVEQVSEEDVE